MNIRPKSPAELKRILDDMSKQAAEYRKTRKNAPPEKWMERPALTGKNNYGMKSIV